MGANLRVAVEYASKSEKVVTSKSLLRLNT
jgi:hypothetical protein